jgi:hypothetical protein
MMRFEACGVALALAFSGTVEGATFEEIVTRQRNGMWEIRRVGSSQPPSLFCVTDEAKLDARVETDKAVKQLGCERQTEAVDGDRFELHWRCDSDNPTLGRFEITSKGTLSSDQLRFESAVSGGGPLIQAIAPTLNGTQEWRWLRPCRPGDKPGLQGR